MGAWSYHDGMTPTTAAPEIRQQLDPESDQFGSSAVRAGEDRWLVGNPVNGAHWAPDAEVEGWTPGTFTAAAPAPAAKQTAPAK